MSDALDALVSGGTAIFKFDSIGDTCKGTVTNVEQTQQTDFTSGKPLFWDDGQPRMQFVVHLDTDARDGADDDGKRRIFAKGQMEKAIKQAIRESKAGRDQIIGGTLAVQYVEDGDPPRPGLNAPKIYRAQFKPSTGAAADLLDAPTPAAAAGPVDEPVGSVATSAADLI